MTSQQSVPIVQKDNIKVMVSHSSSKVYKGVPAEFYFQVFGENGKSFEAVPFDSAVLLKDDKEILNIT